MRRRRSSDVLPRCATPVADGTALVGRSCPPPEPRCAASGLLNTGNPLRPRGRRADDVGEQQNKALQQVPTCDASRTIPPQGYREANGHPRSRRWPSRQEKMGCKGRESPTPLNGLVGSPERKVEGRGCGINAPGDAKGMSTGVRPAPAYYSSNMLPDVFVPLDNPMLIVEQVLPSLGVNLSPRRRYPAITRYVHSAPVPAIPAHNLGAL